MATLPYVNEEPDDISESPSFYKDQEKHVKWIDRILLNRTSKVIIITILTALIIPLLLYSLVFSSSIEVPPSDGFSTGTCNIPNSARLSCGYGDIERDQCDPQCCYDITRNHCYHRLPSRYSYILRRPWSEDENLLPRFPTVPFQQGSNLQQIQNLRISVDEVSSSHLTFNLYDPEKISNKIGARLEDKNYTYNISNPEMNIEVTAPQGLIFSTIYGPLIAADNIWEMVMKLTNETMFGLGEIPLKDSVKIIYSNKNNADSIPVIFAKMNNSFHGMLVENHTPTEITILESNQIIIRSIETEMIRLHLFVGPKPEDIMNDVRQYIGFNNDFKYWMLGPHICNEIDSTLEESYNGLTYFLQNATLAKLYFESHCGVAPIVFNTNREIEAQELLESGATSIQNLKKKFIPHLSPYIHYIDNSENVSTKEISNYELKNITELYPNFLTEFNNLMIIDPDTMDLYKGVINDIEVIYPDYEYIKSTELLNELWTLPKNFDGLVLENSWPLDESIKILNETYKSLPYFNQRFEDAFNNTPLWSSWRPSNESYLYKHNKYGNNFAKAVNEFVNESVPIWTTSQWMNVDVVVNRQNVNATWTNLRRELIQTSLAGVTGQWFWSTPICGDTEHFNPSTQTSLCVKWYMAATYMPLIKIHSKTIERHPLAFTGTDRINIMNALNTRLSLLPYFYTTLQTGPLLRPMFYQFPNSERISNISTQFSVGKDLLIVPNLVPSQSHVNVWMPPGGWYELWSGVKLEAEEGEPVSMATTEADFLTLIQAGSILIMQKELKESSEDTRLNSKFSVIIALNCSSTNELETHSSTSNCHAEGKLYLSKDTTMLMKANEQILTITIEGDYSILCEPDNAFWAHFLNEVHVYGLENSFNNYDNFKRVFTSIDICNIRWVSEITFDFINV